jgi:hypothetical protein
MQKVKEKVILRILVQESLNLELWLERCQQLKFRGLFCEFFLTKDLVEIVFKNQGFNYKDFGPWVDYSKVQSPF